MSAVLHPPPPRRRPRRRDLMRRPRVAASMRLTSAGLAVGGLACIGLSLAVPAVAGDTATARVTAGAPTALPEDGLFDEGRALFVARVPDGEAGCEVRSPEGEVVLAQRAFDARAVGERVVGGTALEPLLVLDGYPDGSTLACEPYALRLAGAAFVMPTDPTPSKVPMGALSSGVAALALGLLGLVVSAPPR